MKIDQRIRGHHGRTIRIFFDLQMLISWAQLHPCTEAFRAMTPYCRNGESELDLLLRDPTEEDANVIVPRWPQIVTDGFGLDKSVYVRKIAIV
ncbi:heterokaryon incompatibility protein het-6-like protein [Colletotrichum kahawae]|uniref:Heterokaryon incompatibility protein het-6-like protein n=1 Tax=Colletotrichum kahawae TaxID=34407 RepID=A0AAD9YH99_COLKA|nr:heterokaryon incompatibility protein het-6-like protein [Colletotrichum kahawae]